MSQIPQIQFINQQVSKCAELKQLKEERRPVGAVTMQEVSSNGVRVLGSVIVQREDEQCRVNQLQVMLVIHRRLVER